MKRRKAQAHENHERWLVSYADFMTLLFAFFVVMFATAQADKSKAKAVSESVREALKNGNLGAAVTAALNGGKPAASGSAASGQSKPAGAPPPARPQPAAPTDLVQSMATLHQALKIEIAAGKVGLNLNVRGLVITLSEAAFFASGDDAVSPASRPTLAKIAAVVRSVPNPIRLEGYTDSVPIHNARFQSNWELSAARSIAMLELLRDEFQIPSSRMSVAGYADNAAADSNDTVQGRARNRRVDVVLLSAQAMKVEPNQGR
jgi:chemotaxis protein MotB